MDDIGSITLTLINNVSINLSGLYIRMSKHSFNGIDVGITFELQSCEGVTAAMEQNSPSKLQRIGIDKT